MIKQCCIHVYSLQFLGTNLQFLPTSKQGMYPSSCSYRFALVTFRQLVLPNDVPHAPPERSRREATDEEIAQHSTSTTTHDDVILLPYQAQCPVAPVDFGSRRHRRLASRRRESRREAANAAAARGRACPPGSSDK